MLPQPSASFPFLPRSTGVQATTKRTKSEDYVNKAINQDGYHATRKHLKSWKGCSGAFLAKTEASHCLEKKHSPTTNNNQLHPRRNRVRSHSEPVNGGDKVLNTWKNVRLRQIMTTPPESRAIVHYHCRTLNLESKVPKILRANPTQQLRKRSHRTRTTIKKLNQPLSSLTNQLDNRSCQID